MNDNIEGSKKRKSVDPVILILILMIAAALATYIVPAGQFERIPIQDTNYSIVDPGSFKIVDRNPIKPFDLFISVTLGLQAGGSIIFSLLIIGGAFKIVENTGALKAGLGSMVTKLSGKELLMIPICMLIFGSVSAFAGCWEEYLPFIPILCAVCIAMGFDSITAVAMVFCGAAAGYAGAVTNVYTVGIAQGIAELPIFSGINFRIVVFICFLIMGIIYVLIYAKKVKKNLEKSSMHEEDLLHFKENLLEQTEEISWRQKLVLFTFFGGFAVIAFCVIKFGFYIDEIGAIFLIVGILAAIIGKMSIQKTLDSFFDGCREFLWVGFIIGLCRGITIMLQDASIFDTIIYYMGSSIGGLGTHISAVGMFVVQSFFNFIVPSGSGQAAITMPFMAPLADLIGITRQTAVLAFQYGDAFTNLIAPTAAPIMAALAMAHIPYNKWIKFILPLWGLWSLIAAISLLVAVSINYGPF